MDMQTVRQIVATPYIEPAAVVKHYLSNPLYLEEWLRAKGKALAGVSNDCSQCIVASYLQEKLTGEGWEFEKLEVFYAYVEVIMESEDLNIKTPNWVRKFIAAIDFHRNNDQSIRGRQRIFSGNLAANILRVTLEARVE
jgi:hypothetical protein